jgi:hypothetical protein
VRFYQHMAQTDAWRRLSGAAAKAWLEISLIENGGNNGRLALSCRAIGERTGLCKTAAADALRELVNAGFLECVKGSSFSQKKLAAEYRLTHVRCAVTGKAPTHDYRRELSIAEAANICGCQPCEIREATDRGAIAFRDDGDRRVCSQASVYAYQQRLKERNP